MTNGNLTLKGTAKLKGTIKPKWIANLEDVINSEASAKLKSTITLNVIINPERALALERTIDPQSNIILKVINKSRGAIILNLNGNLNGTINQVGDISLNGTITPEHNTLTDTAILKGDIKLEGTINSEASAILKGSIKLEITIDQNNSIGLKVTIKPKSTPTPKNYSDYSKNLIELIGIILAITVSVFVGFHLLVRVRWIFLISYIALWSLSLSFASSLGAGYYYKRMASLNKQKISKLPIVLTNALFLGSLGLFAIGYLFGITIVLWPVFYK